MDGWMDRHLKMKKILAREMRTNGWTDGHLKMMKILARERCGRTDRLTDRQMDGQTDI